MKKHWCNECRGVGKVSVERIQTIHGVKKPYAFLVECPRIRLEQAADAPLSAKDRAAGERDDR